MTTPWQTKDLREHVRALGPESASLVRALDSIGRYVDIFRYHLFLARDAMKGVVVEGDPHGLQNLKYILGGSDRQDEYARAKIASEANILGCIHSARALLDVFAFVVNGLVLIPPVPVNVCDIKKVAAALPESALKVRLDELLASYWFGYVSSFVNTAKHRQLVIHGFWMSFETGAAEIRLNGFEYNGKLYQACAADELLQGVIEVKNAIVDCGNLLNEKILGRAEDLRSPSP